MKQISALIITVIFAMPLAAADNMSIQQAIDSAHRNPDNSARDSYRHPLETLTFFGLKNDMKVLEILPGRGWYTEILAPVLKDNGVLTVASFGASNPKEYLRNLHNNYMSMLDASPEQYAAIKRTVFEDNGYLSEISDESQDMVLTFRSTHNWIRYGGVEEIYRSFYRVLKKGGVLGIVQHRAKTGSDTSQTAQKGYVTETYLIQLLEDMGFELVGKSEVNANPKDTKDYAKGVWTLPPSLRAKDGKDDIYMSIGESDRMTLRFVKL